jgi:tetratricopeptide (TPR) repeat protein
MSGEALYERYKDALKRGHVASLRGRVEEALKAYAEAAAIAPERSTPHTSAATALMRRKRPADALRHYTTALALAPRDETAMLGRAQALTALGRRPEAAAAYDSLADLRSTSGKLADAVDAARRALELAEGRDRRRTLEELIERLRASSPGEPGRVALERALRVLDGVALEQASSAGTAAAGRVGAPAGGSAAGADEPDLARDLAEAPDFEIEPPVAEPAPLRAALDRDLPPDLDMVALARRADETIAAGDADLGLPLLLDLASAHRRDGRIDAALDACYLALSLEPDDIGLHLGLVELYDERGWTVLAAEKLDLLDRLVTLDGGAGADRLAAAREARG